MLTIQHRKMRKSATQHDVKSSYLINKLYSRAIHIWYKDSALQERACTKQTPTQSVEAGMFSEPERCGTTTVGCLNLSLDGRATFTQNVAHLVKDLKWRYMRHTQQTVVLYKYNSSAVCGTAWRPLHHRVAWTLRFPWACTLEQRSSQSYCAGNTAWYIPTTRTTINTVL